MLASLFVTGLLATAAASAQDATTTRPGNYVVRPGDTLEGIAQRYLGTSERWRELWQLNQGTVENPNRIYPGLELMIVWRELPEEASILTAAWNRVENLRPPLQDWTDAELNNVLRTKDLLQTYRDSSAELLFPDGAEMRLSEETRLLLESTTRLGTTVKREQVQLLQGQADLEGADLSSEDVGIELVIGDAKAAPTLNEAGEVRARARKAADDSAQLMVYAGASDLQAGGATVAVEEGMGTTAKPGEAPSPPEELLPAPGLNQPEAGAGLSTPRPRFSWSAVDGADHYSLEICRDAACANLERKVSPINATDWTPEAKLPKADLFWRVTATSPSGLDGYPTDGRAITILSDTEDQAPPTVSFNITAPRLAPRWGLNGRWILGPGARFEAVAEDAVSGVERWVPLHGGEPVEVEAWRAGPWPEGETLEASFLAVDKAGNESRLEPVPFVFDQTPPEFSWGVEGDGPLGRLDRFGNEVGPLPRHVARRFLEVTDPHRWWTPWRKQEWQVDLDGRQVVLRPNRSVRVSIEGREVVLGPDRGLWILAEDAICETVFRLDYDLELDREGRWPNKRSTLFLRLEAWDWVENKGGTELRFETVGRR
ncbi:MAG: LysM peptidoglycan-binding domain-containing protein [Acidobacteriota bacterium]